MDTDHILSEHFVSSHPIQAAQAMESLRDDDIVAFMEEMPVTINGKLINEIKPYRGASCLQLVKPVLAKAVIEQMDITAAESLLRHCDLPFRTRLLNSISPKRAKFLREKLEYRADTVGAWMTPRFFALNKEVLVREAIEMVKGGKERVSSAIFVVDKEDELVGNIKISELFFADQTKKLAEIMRTEIPKIFADVQIELMQNHTGWYEYLAIPVVDRSGKLIGTLDLESCQKSNTRVGEELTKEVLETGSALGELYRIGLTGFLHSLSK